MTTMIRLSKTKKSTIMKAKGSKYERYSSRRSQSIVTTRYIIKIEIGNMYRPSDYGFSRYVSIFRLSVFPPPRNQSSVSTSLSDIFLTKE